MRPCSVRSSTADCVITLHLIIILGIIFILNEFVHVHNIEQLTSGNSLPACTLSVTPVEREGGRVGVKGLKHWKKEGKESEREICVHVYIGTSLFQPHLGPAKVAGLVRWLDLREPH